MRFSKGIKYLVFVVVFKPLVWLLLGLEVRKRSNLPQRGPAILVANHNSHLDTIVLMSLLPLRELGRARLVAAADYFLANRFVAWFYRVFFGMIPIWRSCEEARRRGLSDPLTEVSCALKDGAIVIYFPEGTRGEPERFSPFKKGLAHLAARHPQIPVIPVRLQGLGKVLPRGGWVPIPFVCLAEVGTVMTFDGTREGFLNQVKAALNPLGERGTL